ncbi:TetR family transcriptional regulator [Microbacterium sp. A82]|uniref:acyl-CoA-like ligand-binding transcription factor n=1 Tax=Microbacterium sp. A82 TaxID=3450452 RepID=UPI003F305D66
MPSETKLRPGRRPLTTPEKIESTALDLLLERGFDTVSVAELAAAAGVSRATFFRYFATKASVVWWGFDRAVDQLAEALQNTPESVETLSGLRAAIAQSVAAGIDPGGVWWERFVLLDSTPSLRGEATDRWNRWLQVVAAFIAGRMGLGESHPIPAAIAAAHQGAYLATLRTWDGRPGDPHEMLARMMRTLTTLDVALSGLVADEQDIS